MLPRVAAPPHRTGGRRAWRRASGCRGRAERWHLARALPTARAGDGDRAVGRLAVLEDDVERGVEAGPIAPEPTGELGALHLGIGHIGRVQCERERGIDLTR